MVNVPDYQVNKQLKKIPRKSDNMNFMLRSMNLGIMWLL